MALGRGGGGGGRRMPVRPEAAWEETPGAVALRVAARGVPRAQVDVFASDCFVKVRSVPAPAPRPRPPPPRRPPPPPAVFCSFPPERL